jgi:hypothetical protein
MNTRAATALVVLIAAASALAVLFVMPGYATLVGNTYNEGNSSDVKYITIALGENQYSDAVTSTIHYHTIKEIGDGGRVIQYVPEYDSSITVSEVDYDVTQVVVFNISLDASDVIPTYNLHISVDDQSKMTGTFFIKYTVGVVSTNVAFPPSTGITINSLNASSITITMYVQSAEISPGNEPVPPLNDVSFIFRAEVPSS